MCNIILFLSFSVTALAKQNSAVQKVDELTQAYQREILFLSTYKKELIEKKESMENNMGEKVQSAQLELKGLETQWLKLQATNEVLFQKLNEIERDFENKSENKEILETTLKQASFEKDKNQENGKKETTLITKLGSTFDGALEALRNSTKISIKPGQFYSTEGEEQKGQLVALGSVAQFAEKDGKIAALYPSGGGHFRVWSWLEKSNNILMKNEIPENLSFFLYENPNKEFNAQTEKTMLDTLKAGGLIGWVILLMGVFALIVSGVRYYLLNRAELKKTSNLDEVLGKVQSGDLDGAQHILVRENNSVGRVLSKTLSFLRTEPQKVEDAIMEAILKESKIVDRFGVVLIVIASVAPLMGLLGTVTGMISTFDIITLYGTGNPKLLSGGISEALVTTMFGLIVAIPALLIGQYLSSKSEGIKSEMEKWALATCNAYKNSGVQKQ